MNLPTERAESAMLEQGPHILEAMRTLDSVLRRTQDHPSQSRPPHRARKSWNRVRG
jgi:pyruvate kinase